jgi:predicted dehydrogenase
MYNAALVGFGRFGLTLFEKFEKLCKINFVCTRKTSQKLLEFADKKKIKLTENYLDVLTQVDLIIIATPTASHFSIAKDCLNRKKNVFVEKPLAADINQAKELVELSNENNTNLYVDDVFLYRREYVELKKQIQEDNISEISFIWRKYGSFDDLITNSLVYHDMYLLIDLLGMHNMESLNISRREDPNEKGRCDILEISFKYDGVLVKCGYDRLSDKKEKVLKITNMNKHRVVEWKNNQVTINNQVIKEIYEDALFLMIHGFLEGNTDCTKNNLIALQTLEHISTVCAKAHL